MAGREKRRDLDEVDHSLVAELRRDGRVPNVELARALGVSEKTVRARITRLVEEFGLRITAELTDPGPPESGLPCRMVHLVRAEVGSRFEVADFLAARAEVDVVHLTTGSADVLVEASFPDDAAALRFLARTVEGHPGVRWVESCRLVTEVGRDPAIALPGGPVVDADALASAMIGAPRHADLDELCDCVCDAATDGLGADRALVATAADGGWVVANSRGVSDRYLRGLDRLSGEGATDGVITRVWSTRLCVFVPDARTDPLLAAAHSLVRAEGYVSDLTLPMLYGDSLVASVSLFFDAPRALDDAYISAAQGVADSFAVTMARMLGRAPAVSAGR